MIATPELSIVSCRLDALSEIQALHALSFKTLARRAHTAKQIAAYTNMTQSDAYRADLEAGHLLMARFGDQVVATAGWIEWPGKNAVAQLGKVFVHPDMSSAGLGRRMVQAAENAARRQGFKKFAVRASKNTTSFYERMGYLPGKPETFMTGGEKLPVTLMKKG